VHEILFQLSQPIFGGLGWGPVDDHSLDVSLLLGDALLGFGESICRERVIAVISDHAPKMRPKAYKIERERPALT
jgi:hypothetical protein